MHLPVYRCTVQHLHHLQVSSEPRTCCCPCPLYTCTWLHAPSPYCVCTTCTWRCLGTELFWNRVECWRHRPWKHHYNEFYSFCNLSLQYFAVTVWVYQSRTLSSTAVNVLFVPAAAATMKGIHMWPGVHLYKWINYPVNPFQFCTLSMTKESGAGLFRRAMTAIVHKS